MTVNVGSIAYALVVCALFYICPGAARKYILALGSIVYIFSINTLAGGAVLLVGVFTYAIALLTKKLQNDGGKGASVAAYTGVAILVCSLLVFKYFPVYFTPLAGEDSFFKNILMPVGYSFYVFQAIGYLIDVKKKNVEASANIFEVVLFLAWFPKFVSGPIERWNSFIPQIKSLSSVKLVDVQRWKRVVYYVMYGIFMKVVIADRLGIYVDKLFEATENCGSLWLILGSLFYTVQIYCDFAGYSYFAIGISAMFGIELVMNFSEPYCSQNITEFWRRWHMSLSSWLRDYVYIPLGGNRKGATRKIINTMIVFLICGMWHGAGKNFIFWGLLHGVFSAVDSIVREKGIKVLRTGVIGTVIAFCEASFAWIFFRASSLKSGILYVKAMFLNISGYFSFTEQMDRMDLEMVEFVLIIILIVLMAILDRVAYTQKTCMPELIAGGRQELRYVALYLLIMVVVIFGIYGPDISTRLIYMDF